MQRKSEKQLLKDNVVKFTGKKIQPKENLMIGTLPLPQNVETANVLKKTISANRALATLNGAIGTIPNSLILINSLVLQEAKDSSAIENIITTHDELYRANIDIKNITSQVKEVQNYKEALLQGLQLIKKDNLLLKKHIVEIQSILENNNAGIRKQSGTNLKNTKTGEVVYTPPQNQNDIEDLLSNLERYINTPNDIDPLINMAIIHYQFESIHPFYDGNGRTGRIINILYLVIKGLLDIPILYMSRYITLHKNDYYSFLQNVREKNSWEEWILFMLKAVEQTSLETIELIREINNLMVKIQGLIYKDARKIYSKDLVEILFIHPYTKIEFLTEGLKITRQTASKYLNKLEEIGILKNIQIKNSKFFINTKLFEMLEKRQ